MQSATFQLSTINNRPVITMPGTELQVNIYNLEEEPFYPDPEQVHLFGDDHGAPIAFEADWRRDGVYYPALLTDINAAITWYANYLDYPNMIITAEDPRPRPKMRVVR